VSPERDDPTDDQEELYEDVPPRSIFAATWFRVVLVVIVLGVVGAIAVPYALDWMNPPPPPRSAATKTPMVPTSPTPSVVDKPADKPSSERAPSEKSTGEKSSVGDKKDSTLLPAPGATSTAPPATSRPEPKPESKPSATPKPSAEPKSIAKAAPSTESKAPSTESKAMDPPTRNTPPAGESATKPNATKPAPSKPDVAVKTDPAPATATKPSATKPAAAKATTPAPAIGGAPYWVQVGAFKDPEAAKRLAGKLRDENFKVEESFKQVGGSSAMAAAPAKPPAGSSSTMSGADQYDVFITGMSADELNRRLAGKGLAAEPSGNGVIVKPSLPLRDAVALSKDLAVEGFKVQVRRAGTTTPVVTPPTAAAPAPGEGGLTLHRVRVGSFADRAAAQAAARELEAKGYKPYIARGDQ
jgi:cell division septation protein DedD